MTPANRRPATRATVASWVLVTALGLSIGAIGLGGVLDLFRGEETVGLTASGTFDVPPAPALTTDPAPSESPSASPSDGTLGGTVVAPQQVPAGRPLEGPAPSPRGVAAGTYVPFRPTVIRLPSGASAPVQQAGVHPDGALSVPEDPGRVGWWTGGAEAGDPYGSIVLAGHVDSRVYGLGVMAEMLDMRLGQTITLSRGELARTYRVVSRTEITKASLAAGTDLFDQAVPHRLVMITCGGPFDRRTHRYRDNVVVVADPSPPTSS